MKKKILIVEDEVLISEHLKSIVNNLGYEALEICADFNEAMELLKRVKPDLAFLDIRIQGEDQGVEVAKELNKLDIPFVFITSFSDKETLKKAINQQPLGYVLKPFNKEEIEAQLNFIEDEFIGQFITLGKPSDKTRIAIKDILWLRSENVYVEVQTRDKMYIFREKLQAVQDRLPSRYFVRTNQSHVVNLAHVISVSADSISLEKSEIPLSKKYKKYFFEQFANL